MSGWTLAFQAVNFLILAGVLYRFLWKPVMNTIARRQKEIGDASNAAEFEKQAAEESRTRYEQERERLASEREHLLEDLRAEVARERQQVLDRARAEAAEVIDAARNRIAQEERDAVGRLTEHAIGLATDIAARFLAQVPAAAVNEPFLERLCTELEGMPPERIQALQQELDGGATSVLVAVAAPLAPDQEKRWAERVEACLGRRSIVRFAADPTLIAGAELRLPHTSLSFSWREGLRDAREELAGHAHTGSSPHI